MFSYSGEQELFNQANENTQKVLLLYILSIDFVTNKMIVIALVHNRLVIFKLQQLLNCTMVAMIRLMRNSFLTNSSNKFVQLIR